VKRGLSKFTAGDNDRLSRPLVDLVADQLVHGVMFYLVGILMLALDQRKLTVLPKPQVHTPIESRARHCGSAVLDLVAVIAKMVRH
jgi:hypothetical protein